MNGVGLLLAIVMSSYIVNTNVLFPQSYGSFVFYVDLFLSFLYYWQYSYQFSLCVTRRLSYMKMELLIIRDHLELTRGFRWGLSCSSYFLCCIFVLFVLFCVLYPVLKVSLDRPFLVAPFSVPKCSFMFICWLTYIGCTIAMQSISTCFSILS